MHVVWSASRGTPRGLQLTVYSEPASPTQWNSCIATPDLAKRKSRILSTDFKLSSYYVLYSLRKGVAQEPDLLARRR